MTVEVTVDEAVRLIPSGYKPYRKLSRRRRDGTFPVYLRWEREGEPPTSPPWSHARVVTRVSRYLDDSAYAVLYQTYQAYEGGASPQSPASSQSPTSPPSPAEGQLATRQPQPCEGCKRKEAEVKELRVRESNLLQEISNLRCEMLSLAQAYSRFEEENAALKRQLHEMKELLARKFSESLRQCSEILRLEEDKRLLESILHELLCTKRYKYLKEYGKDIYIMSVPSLGKIGTYYQVTIHSSSDGLSINSGLRSISDLKLTGVYILNSHLQGMKEQQVKYLIEFALKCYEKGWPPDIAADYFKTLYDFGYPSSLTPYDLKSLVSFLLESKANGSDPIEFARRWAGYVDSVTIVVRLQEAIIALDERRKALEGDCTNLENKVSRIREECTKYARSLTQLSIIHLLKKAIAERSLIRDEVKQLAAGLLDLLEHGAGGRVEPLEVNEEILRRICNIFIATLKKVYEDFGYKRLREIFSSEQNFGAFMAKVNEEALKEEINKLMRDKNLLMWVVTRAGIGGTLDTIRLLNEAYASECKCCGKTFTPIDSGMTLARNFRRMCPSCIIAQLRIAHV